MQTRGEKRKKENSISFTFSTQTRIILARKECLRGQAWGFPGKSQIEKPSETIKKIRE